MGRPAKKEYPKKESYEVKQKKLEEALFEAKVGKTAQEIAKSGMEPGKAEVAARAAVKAVEKATKNKSVFALKEWTGHFARAAGEGWLNDPQWGEMRAMIARSVGLMALAPAQSDKDWSVWADKEHLEAEAELLEMAKRVDKRHEIPESLVQEVLAGRPSIEDEQRESVIASCSGDKAVVITEGTAGAGKSYTLDVIKEIYQKIPESAPGEGVGYDIVGTALSWNAAKVLQASAKLDDANAMQGLLNDMDNAKESGGSYFKRRTLVIVDEAGLVPTKMMRDLLRHAQESKAHVRLLLTGDSLQLNPVEPGNALEAMVDEIGSSRLNVIRRQERKSHMEAVKDFCFGRAEQGLWTYWQQEALWMCPSAEARRERVMRDYVRTVAAHPMDSCLVLALDNAEVKKLNESVRERLKQAGLLAGAEHEIVVNNGQGPYKARFCVGDRVVLRKNLRNQPVYESEFGKEEAHKAALVALAAGKKQDETGVFSKMLASLASGLKEEPRGEEIRKGVFNRSSGIILGIKKSPNGPGDRVVRMWLAEGGETEFDTALLRDKASANNPEEAPKGGGKPGDGDHPSYGADKKIDTSGVGMHHNFATTIYASQGQTVDRVLLMDAKNMNRRLAYVGMSRHRIECDVYADATDLDARRRFRTERALSYTWSPREKERCQEILGTKFFEDGDLWAEMALCWNGESKNQTVTMALRGMAERKERQAREGAPTGRLRPAEGCDPDDHPKEGTPGAPTAKEDPDFKKKWRVAPPRYADLVASAPSQEARKPGFFSSWLGAKGASAPSPVEVDPKREGGAGSLDLPEWSKGAEASEAVAELEGLAWGRSRWGEPRLFALDKKGRRVARWSWDGQCKAGSAEPPVLANAPESPWMVVAGAREALLSWSVFKKKHKGDPGRAPSIAIAFPGADLSALSEWVGPAQALHCAWSPRDPKSLGWAVETAARLEALGFKASVYPKAPEPEAPGRKAKLAGG